MLDNQDFMELRLRNHVALKDEGTPERARNDDEHLINGFKWSYDYFDHDQTDLHVQIVPEIHQDQKENSKDNNLLVVVPDEHSETGDYHYTKEDYYSDTSDSQSYLRDKHQKPKRRRTEISSDEESEGFTREVPSVTRNSSKRRRRDEMMNIKMRTLQQLVPNCHKMDNVSVLDKTIEYMKNLQLQLQMMSIMGMNTPYIPPAILGFGMQHHYLLTAMAHSANQTMSSQLLPVSNWPLPPFTNLSFPHITNPSLLASPAGSPQCLCSLIPCFPTFPNFASYTMGRL